MRKIIIILGLLILLFTMTSCDTKVNSTIYISSIGIEVKNEKINFHFLANPLTDISRNKSEASKESEVLKIEASTVYEAFNTASLSLLTPLNFKHIKTVIMHTSFFDSKYIDEFLQYIKSVRYISYNFYVFSTNEDITEIYNFKNPEQISYQYSLLSSPDLLDYSNYGVDRLHFLDFTNDYLVEKRYLHIPKIVINKNWNKNMTLEVDGFLCVDDNLNYYLSKEYPGMLYLTNKNTIIFNDGENIYRIEEYMVSNKIIDGKFTILISYKNIVSFYGGSRLLFENKITSDIKKYLDTYITNQGKLYMIEFYNYLNKTSFEVDKYEIEILYKG